ncbi:MAG: esterase [Massilia sp.]|jgi:poly(hydroxyalkanoate) depolymerase family esterase|nr:esterase [Massilia sp.]MDB5949964.1 esterase [Massilia sp.]
MLNPMLDALTSMARMSPWDAVPFGFGLSLPSLPSLPSAAPEAKPNPKSKAGNFLSERFIADFGSLKYKLFVPSAYDAAGAPLPLVVMLHGYGQDADDFARGTGMNALAEKYGCLVAYPEQSGSASGAGCWNWFERAHHHRGQGEPALIAGVATRIMSEYAVDARKVFVAGLSSGGAMAVIVGRTYPDLFAAVGCHSGLAHGAARDSFGAMQAMLYGAGVDAHYGRQGADSVPTIVFHGDLDSTVHPNNARHVVEQTIRAGAGFVTSREIGEATGRIFTRVIHRSTSGGVVAEQWTLHGAGHAWSGGSRRGSYTDATGPDASEEMMRFFLQSAPAC